MSDDLKETKNGTNTEDNVSSKSLFNRNRGLLREFEFVTVKPSNTSCSVSIPLNTSPTIIASLTEQNVLCVDDECDRVCLNCTVGWEAIANAATATATTTTTTTTTDATTTADATRQNSKVDVLFMIFRDNPCNGSLIFSCLQSANANEENFQTTCFNHVDMPLLNNVVNPCEDDDSCCGDDNCCNPDVPYFLTAVLPEGGEARVIGPITFTGSKIVKNPR